MPPTSSPAAYRPGIGSPSVLITLARGVDAQPAEGEGDAAGHRVGLVGRGVEHVGPVRLVDREPRGAAPVLDVRVERHLGLDRGVVGLDLGQRRLGVDVVELRDERLERVGGRLGHLLDLVFVAQQVLDLPVEHLPGELPRLVEDHAAVLGVGVVAKVRALVDEALAFGVEHDAEGVGVLLELVAHREVAELGCVALPAHGVTARPVADRGGADVERHADHVAGVEARAAHLGQLPARAEVARAPLGVGLEAAAGEHHGFRLHLDRLAFLSHAHAVHAAVVGDQRGRARAVPDLHAVLLRRPGPGLDQPFAAADGLDGEPAPELELAVDLERLPAVDRREADALAAHPQQRLEALLDQDLGQVGVAAVLRDAPHVVEELLLGVGAEVGARDLLVGQVGHQTAQVVHARRRPRASRPR